MQPFLPLIGRQEQHAQLHHLLAAARRGQGHLALVGGEAGVGKTRLLETVLGEADTPSAFIGRCPGPGETPPYGPWLELAAKLQAQAGLDPALLPPPLGSAAGAGGAFPLASALATWLSQHGQPLVLVVEDLQWADPASLDLLRHLAPHLVALPVLAVATYRSEEVNRAHPLWTVLPELQRSGASRLHLDRLTLADVAALTRAALPEVVDHQALAQQLHARTGGHTLFVRHLLAAIQRDGLASPDLLPETVQQAIDQRLLRLRPATQGLLETAAVLGEWFDYDLLATVAAVPEDELLEALEESVALRIIRPDEGNGEHFTFDHALVRDVLASHLIAPRRRRLHLRIAEALLAGTQPDPERVALHLSRAGDPRAGRYLAAAAHKASDLVALDQAGQYLQQALDFLPPADPLRVKVLLDLGINLSHIDRHRSHHYLEQAIAAAEAQDERGVAVFARLRLIFYDFAEHVTLDELAELGRVELALADDPGLKIVAPYLFHSQARVAQFRMLLENGRIAEARTLLGQFAENAKLHEVRDLYGALAYAEGRVADWLQCQEEVTAFFQREPGWSLPSQRERLTLRLLYSAQEPALLDTLAVRFQEVEAWSHRTGYPYMPPGFSDVGDYQFLRGDWTGARHNLVEYLQAGNRPLPIDRAARPWAALLLLLQGDLAGSRAMLAPAHPTHPTDKTGFCFRPLLHRWLQVRLHLAVGDAATARAWLDAANRWLEGAPQHPERPFIALAWAEYAQTTRAPQAAWEHAQRALRWADEANLAWVAIMAHRLLGELAAAVGRPAEAGPHLQAALHLAQACHFPYEVALTQVAQAEALGQRANLANACATLEGLGATPALQRARSLHGAPTVASLPDGLTQREVEVIRLVAQGLTDKEVGEQLHISPRTVDAHLRHIFGKVGAGNRTTLAAYATRHGLL